MKTLEEYLATEYEAEKDLYNQVDKLISDTLSVYESFDSEKGWPYALPLASQDGETSGKADAKFSFSTTSMVAFSLCVLFGNNLDLTTNQKSKNYIKERFKDEEESIKLFHRRLGEAVALIWKEFKTKQKASNGSSEPHFSSSTYGINDPLTLVWNNYLLEYMSQHFQKHQEADCNNLSEDLTEVAPLIRRVCVEAIKNISETVNLEEFCKKVFRRKTTSGEAQNSNTLDTVYPEHVFPLLKIVQLWYGVKNGFDLPPDWGKHVRALFEDKLHHHLSLASIKNSEFDSAELVFALEGMLLLHHDRKNFEQSLLDRVFAVVKERQSISLYWRPLKPFVYTRQGLALLPLSVEIAMSLIRICRLLDDRGDRLFSSNFEIFKNYTEWLHARIAKVNDKDENGNAKEYTGWSSEHIYSRDIIHPWETSQVLVYLANFNDMLQKHIANESLRCARLTVKPKDERGDDWQEWQEKEPFSAGDETLKAFSQIGEMLKEGDNKYFSLLLYGPPGTGKTTIAEKIAEHRGWPLITITPSDFIASGTDQVEAKAKNLFTVLREQKDKVVLFDEIDRLILDRDSIAYHSQSTIFQFMTPSMLDKFSVLREQESIIFIISTNYENRIDAAIKRRGRIDQCIMVLPPDKNRREQYFNSKDLEIPEENQKEIVRKTALYVHGELKQLLNQIKQKKQPVGTIISRMPAPAISLTNYLNRICGTKDKEGKPKHEEGYPQKPTKEFLCLWYIAIEAQGDAATSKLLTGDALEDIYPQKEDLCKKLKKHLPGRATKKMRDEILNSYSSITNTEEGGESAQSDSTHDG